MSDPTLREMADRAQWKEMNKTLQGLTQGLTQVLQQAVQGGNHGAGDLHKKFRGMNPPKFYGSPDPDEAEQWIKEMERIFKVMQCSDQECVLLATFQLVKDIYSL